MTAFVFVLTASTSALMAGLFFAYSCSVNIGLGRLPDVQYLKAMQSINRAILNPAFLFCFLGTAVFLPLSAWLSFGRPIPIGFYFWSAAAALYLVCVLMVTLLGNVPLNDALDKFNTANATTIEISRQRKNFEIKWNHFHLVRTIASILSFVLVAIACLVHPF